MVDASLICLRILKSFDLRLKHPDSTPVYVEAASDAKKKSVDVGEHTFVVPQNARLSSVIERVRKRMSTHEANANAGYLFFVKDGTRKVLPSPSDLIKVLYNKYMDADGFLHIVIDREDIFG